MSQETLSNLTIKKLNIKLKQKYGENIYFDDDLTIHLIESLVAQNPILNLMNYKNLTLPAILKLLSKHLKEIELKELKEENNKIIFWIDIKKEIKFISLKEFMFMFMLLMISKSKAVDVKMYFYSDVKMYLHNIENEHIKITSSILNNDLFNVNQARNTVQISFNVKDFISSEFQTNFLDKTILKIKSKLKR